jgi:hypothetical protein
LIAQTPFQEIGTHTYSHYYTLESGADIESFRSDIITALNVNKSNQRIQSIIFPRNQYNTDFLQVLRELNIRFYRGSQDCWIYKPEPLKSETFLKRLMRLADAYVNITGYNTFVVTLAQDNLKNIPASAFLRPYSTKVGLLENFRFKRIANAMTNAAVNKSCYHLWWHPHNFGSNMSENFAFLEKILKHYQLLNDRFAFRSKCMNEY